MGNEFEELWAKRPWHLSDISDKEKAERWFNLGKESQSQPAGECGELVEEVRDALSRPQSGVWVSEKDAELCVSALRKCRFLDCADRLEQALEKGNDR